MPLVYIIIANIEWKNMIAVGGYILLELTGLQQHPEIKQGVYYYAWGRREKGNNVFQLNQHCTAPHKNKITGKFFVQPGTVT